uniref:Uncharacterized protein n=1 Tax=Populus trichocarpa TaxID=3694 RepID=A0A3N7FY10_POPTR
MEQSNGSHEGVETPTPISSFASESMSSRPWANSAESSLTGIRQPLLGSLHAPRKRDAEKNNFRIKFHRSGYTKFCLKNIIYLKLADDIPIR